jgi:hypothetical protein
MGSRSNGNTGPRRLQGIFFYRRRSCDDDQGQLCRYPHFSMDFDHSYEFVIRSRAGKNSYTGFEGNFNYQPRNTGRW